MEDNVVFNEDDCLMLGSPANNIHFRNSYCSGGHGLSIGPHGKGGAVDIQNVLYVFHILGKSISLILPLKDGECNHGRTVIVFLDQGFTYMVAQENSFYGARFKSWTGAGGIARKCKESPQYILNGSDWIELVSPGETSR